MVSPLATRAVNGESKKPANRGLFCASAVPVYRWRSRRLYYLQQAQRANLSTQGDDFYVFVKNFHKTTCKKSAMSLDFSNSDAGWSSLAARRGHNPKGVGSNPTPATRIFLRTRKPPREAFLLGARMRRMSVTAIFQAGGAGARGVSG